MKVIKITKAFRRTLTDNQYGSYHFSTEITVEGDIIGQKELEKASDRVSQQVLDLTQKDLDEYLQVKKNKEVL